MVLRHLAFLAALAAAMCNSWVFGATFARAFAQALPPWARPSRRAAWHGSRAGAADEADGWVRSMPRARTARSGVAGPPWPSSLTPTELDILTFWQALFASAALGLFIIIVLFKVRRAGDLRDEWAAKEEELRKLQVGSLSGKPSDVGEVNALLSELDRLQGEELAARTMLVFVLPQPQTPTSRRMAAASCSTEAAPALDEREEVVLVLCGVSLLTLFLLYVSGFFNA